MNTTTNDRSHLKDIGNDFFESDRFKSVVPDGKVWTSERHGRLAVRNLVGGVPLDPRITEGWIKTKLGVRDDELRKHVVQSIAERMEANPEELTDDEIFDEAVKGAVNINGFKRDEKGLYYEGRCLKAALKEAVMVAVAAGKLPNRYGATSKGAKSWTPEHVFVQEERLYLTDEDGNVLQSADEVQLRFVHTAMNGAALANEEVIWLAYFDFTIVSDADFTDDEWHTIMAYVENEGVGSVRSQGAGRCRLIEWVQKGVDSPRPLTKAAAERAQKESEKVS
jgi:hypothetical protein